MKTRKILAVLLALSMALGAAAMGAAAAFTDVPEDAYYADAVAWAAEKKVTAAQIAMSWIFRQELNVFAVVSMSSPERMRSCLEALDLKLTEQECRYLETGER